MAQSKSSKNQSAGFFARNKVSLIIGAVALVLILVGTIIAVNIIRHNQTVAAEERLEQENAQLLDRFRNAYLATYDYTAEQKTCVWDTLNSLVNEQDMLDAAKQYDTEGAVSKDSVFVKKVRSAIGNVNTQCKVAKNDKSEKAFESVTDIIDINLSGSGNMSSETFELNRGLTNITVTAPYNVGFELKSTDGSFINCYGDVGDYQEPKEQTSTVKCVIDRKGEYFLDIHMMGANSGKANWKINLKQE